MVRPKMHAVAAILAGFAGLGISTIASGNGARHADQTSPTWFVPQCSCVDPDQLSPMRCITISVRDGTMLVETPTADRIGPYDAVKLDNDTVLFWSNPVDQVTGAFDKIVGVVSVVDGSASVYFGSSGEERKLTEPPDFPMTCVVRIMPTDK